MRTGMVLAVTATVAGCGTVTGPSAGGLPPHPGSSPASSTAEPGPPAGSRAEAAALAAQMLSRLRLPSGTRGLPQVPVPSSLSQPAAVMAAAATSLDEYRLFAVAQPAGAVAAALTADEPAGMVQTNTGESTGPGGLTTWEVGDTPRSVPAGIDFAQLVLTVVPATSGGSLLRADARVIWYPPRTAAEYVDPAGYHALTVTVMILSPRPYTMRAVTTSRAVIARLAEALDRSQAAPAMVPSCPVDFASYRLALAVSARTPPVVVIATTRFPCGGMQISVGGRPQPPLEDAGTVVAVADQLIGLTPQP
jgi:hypothetical protein